MAKIYLQLDYSNSEMYEYSKTEKEGYVPYTSSTGNTTYRKHYPKGVYGTLLNVGVRESNYGDNLQVSLKNGEDFVHLQFGLYDQKGNIENRYAESLIRYIPNMKKGEGYRIFPYKISAEDQKKQDVEQGNEVRGKYYDLTGVSVKYADVEAETVSDKVEPALLYAGSGGDVIPRVEWKENRAGKKMPDPVALAQKNDFLLDKLMEAVEGHLAYEQGGVQSNAKPQAPKIATPQEAFEATEIVEEDDDLPF